MLFSLCPRDPLLSRAFLFVLLLTFVYFPCDSGSGVLFHPEKNLSVLPRMNFQGCAGGEGAEAVAACSVLHFERIVYCSNKWKVSAREQAMDLSIQGKWDTGLWAVLVLSWSPFAVCSRTLWGGIDHAGSTDRFSMKIVSRAFLFCFLETVPCNLVSSNS